MKTLILIISILSFAITSCDRKTFESERDFSMAQLASEKNIDRNLIENDDLLKTKYFPIPFGSEENHLLFPFPSNWHLKDLYDPYVAIQSPDDIKVFTPIVLNFSQYRDESQNRDLKKWGASIAAVKDLNTYISEELIPLADSLNVQLINRFELAKGESVVQLHDALTISTFKPDTTIIKKIAVEGLNSNGIRSLIIIEHYVKKYETLDSWGVILYSMEASASQYDHAKSLFIESINNVQPCYLKIFDQNKSAIYAITNNRTAQYFPPEQERKRQEAISAEQKRTGTYQYDSFETYIARLKERGIYTNDNVLEACGKIHISKSEKQQHDDYVGEYLYDPSDWNATDILTNKLKKDTIN